MDKDSNYSPEYPDCFENSMTELLRISARQMLARTLMNSFGSRLSGTGSRPSSRFDPIRGAVTGAPEQRPVNESLDQQNRMAKPQGSVVRKAPLKQRQRARGKIGSWPENEKAALVGNQMRSLGCWADPTVSGDALQCTGVERRQRNPLAVHRRRIKRSTFADLRRRLQKVTTVHQFLELRFFASLDWHNLQRRKIHCSPFAFGFR